MAWYGRWLPATCCGPAGRIEPAPVGADLDRVRKEQLVESRRARSLRSPRRPAMWARRVSTPIPGSAIAGSVFTVYLFPRSFPGTAAPRTAAFLVPALVVVPDEQLHNRPPP